jgi:hypothetical protein
MTDHKKFIGSVILFLTAASAQGQSRFVEPPPRLGEPTKSTMKLEDSHVTLKMAAGSGRYSTLELPMMPQSNERVDGSETESDVAEINGLLLDLNLGWLQKTSLTPVDIVFGVQQISSAPSSAEPGPSSYARLSATASTQFEMTSTGTSFVPGLQARRSMFRNVDSGHYLDSVLVLTGIDQKLSREFTFGVKGGVTPWTKFGVLQNSDYGKSGVLAQTSAKMKEIGSTLSWTPEPETSFYLGVFQEDILVIMRSMAGYRSFGLPARELDEGESQRTYNLSAREISIGATKRF